MKIITLIKYSLDTSEIRVNPDTKEINLKGVPAKIGNIDKNVVEAAVRLREINGGDIVGLMFGPMIAKESFKDVLAMGLDEVYLVEEPNQAIDCKNTVRILEEAIKKLGNYDLIICGFASDDGYTFQVGPRLAERLNIPIISYVQQFTIENGTIQADRDLEDSVQKVMAKLPAIISIAEEAYPPRRVTLMDALKAKQKPITIWKLEDLGISIDKLLNTSSFTSLGTTGIIIDRKQIILRNAPPNELADKLLDALLNENIIRETTNHG